MSKENTNKDNYFKESCEHKKVLFIGNGVFRKNDSSKWQTVINDYINFKRHDLISIENNEIPNTIKILFADIKKHQTSKELNMLFATMNILRILISWSLFANVILMLLLPQITLTTLNTSLIKSLSTTKT